MKYILGIDIGGMSSKIGIFTAGPSGTLNLLRKVTVPTRVEDNGKHILPDVSEVVLRELQDMEANLSEVVGVGFGVPGPVVLVDGNEIVNRCVNLGWDRKDLAAEFAELSGIPKERIRVANDANVATLGELRFGAGRKASSVDPMSEVSEDAGTFMTEYFCDGAYGPNWGATIVEEKVSDDEEYHAPQNALMVALGTGIGAGLVLNGMPVFGAHGAAGEFGHMKVIPAMPLPSSISAPDELEHYVSAAGIERVGRAMIDSYTVQYCGAEAGSGLQTILHPGNLTAKSIFDAAIKGDTSAKMITLFFFDTLGAALANVATVIDPELIIIGGGLSGSGEFLRKGLEDVFRENAFHACANTEFRIAELGNDAGIYGCACFAMSAEQ